jgi:biuret amidohydrolase
VTEIKDVLAAKQDRIDREHGCRAGRTALLVVDMQRGFLEPEAALEIPPGRAIVPNIRSLVDVCRGRQIPVIFTQFVYSSAVPCLRGDPFGPEHLPAEKGAAVGFGRPSSNCLIGPGGGQGLNAAEMIPELAPRADELVIAAHTYDKFYGTPLELALAAQDVRWLIVTGVMTDVCVNSTVLAAANRNYRVTVVSDGVATLWPEIQQACFDIWRRKFARLRTAAELIDELGRLS